MRSFVIIGMKTSLSIILLLWLFNKALKSGAISVLTEINLLYFILACLIHFVAFVWLLLRWKTVLATFYDLRITSLARSFYIGVFCNNFLPGSIGGDFVRGTYLYKQGLSGSDLFICLVADRFIGVLITLFLSASVLSIISFDQLNTVIGRSYILTTLLVMIFSPGGAYLIVRRLRQKVKFRERYTVLNSLMDRLIRISELFMAKPLHFVLVVLISFFSTLCVIGCYYFIAHALAIHIPLDVFFVVVPLSFFATSLPVSIGGLGVREGTIVYLLLLFGIPTENAIPVTVAYLLVLIIVSLPGGLLLWRQSITPIERDSN